MAPARQADIPIEERARHTQCMQKALTQMNVQLTNVITDIAGETGMKIIRAIVAGERDRLVLAKQRNYRIHASSEEIAKSLEGNWSCEHLFSLGHELKAYDFASEQIRQLDIEIESLLSAMQVFDRTPTANANKGRRKNTLAFDGRKVLMNWCGVDLTAVPGIDVGTALKILSELGSSLVRFPTPKNFCSWLGLCPGTRISGNKRLSGASKRIPNRVARALKLARIVYAMLSGQADYVKEDQARHEVRYRERAIKSLQKRAQELGLVLSPQAVSVSI